MGFLVYLGVAVLLFAAVYLLSRRTPRKQRAAFWDAERAVAMKKVPPGEKRVLRTMTTFDWPPADLQNSFALDQKAADAQLLDEFAASTSTTTASDHPPLNTDTNGTLTPPQDSAEPIYYVNPKQYHRILKRRIFRQELAQTLRKTEVAKMQARTLRGSRGAGGGLLMALS